MFISLSSVMNTTIWMSLLILLLLLLTSRPVSLLKLSLPVIVATGILILLRLLLPLEFFFTHTIGVKKILPVLYSILRSPLIIHDTKTLRLYHVLGCIWFIGSTILFIRMALSYRRLHNILARMNPVTDPDILTILKEVNSQFKHPRNFSLLTSPNVVSPFITGLYKSAIVIPDTDWKTETIQHILNHELHHFYRGHLQITFFCECVRNIYFWNPLIHMLVNRLDLILELDVDKSVTDTYNKQDKLSYMDCLLYISKRQYKSRKNTLPGIAFTTSQTSGLKQRINYLLNPPKSKWTQFHSILFYGMLCTLITLSLLCICEPTSPPKEVNNGIFTVDEENSYFIQRQDGLYDFYFNNTYTSTVKEIFDTTIPVKETLP